VKQDDARNLIKYFQNVKYFPLPGREGLTVSPDLSKIPQELKDRPQWVAFKTDKTPVNPKTGGNAQADNPDTWGTCEQAIKYYNAHKHNGIAGIGYEFSYYDPYTGLDWDDCRDSETGQLKYCAQVLLDYFDSFGEVSPSKTGIHILVEGKIPIGEGNQKALNCGGKVEAYRVDRYFTVTGNHLPGTPDTINPRDIELKAFHSQVIAKTKAPPKSPGPSPTLNMADSEIIGKAKAAQNGDKFDRLWRGDISEYDGDDSAADMALCSILAFWIQNPGQIDRIFRTSGLFRDKWDSRRGASTYGAKTIDKALDTVTETYQGPRSASKHEANVPKQPPSPIAVQYSGLPTWPKEIMAGAAGRFSKTYAAYLETPKAFLFMAYLTFLGHLISDKITLQSELNPQPRLFTIPLGESADARKSTAIEKTHSFFREVINPDDFNAIWGVGSAEGLAKCFKKNARAILILDELKSLIQKMRIDASVLLPCINTLFESKRFHSLTKKHDITIDDAELCLLAASTLETYRNMFNSTFMDIGFLNRLFIVIGDSQRKFSIPEYMPENKKESLKNDLKDVLSFVGDLSEGGRYAIPINSTARDIFDEWYFNLESSAFTKRLDTYGHRLMPLLAVNEMVSTITPEIAEKTVTLLNYQLAARKFADPIDADSAIARLEERIRRLLSGGSLLKRDLERRVNKGRVGIWAWEQAIKNLRNAGEIFWDSKTGEFRLNA
jgi:putative DNA primase/helicase